MTNAPCLAGYSIEFGSLTLLMQKELKEIYDYGVLIAKEEQIKKGFYVYRVNKATKTGTTMKCKPITDDNIVDILENHKKELDAMGSKKEEFGKMLCEKADKIKEILGGN